MKTGEKHMKKFLVVALAAALTLGGVSLALANGSAAGISGSPHDFSDGTIKNGKPGATITDETWNYRGEICRVCHAPHDKGRTNYTNGLLWNHAVSTEAYTMYASETLDGVTDGTPGGNTKLCLSCHDGSVGLDTFDSHAGATPAVSVDGGIGNLANGSLVINTDLQGTHPVSITYNDTADAGLLDPATATWADGTTVAATLQGNKVQCSTCHDVHDKLSVAGTHLLRTANGSSNPSGLCLTCHNK